MNGETHLSSRQIHLDSSDANYTDNSKWAFFFQDYIVTPPNVQMLVSLVNATFPMSFFIVNQSNNKVVYNTSTYLIPFGNLQARGRAIK